MSIKKWLKMTNSLEANGKGGQSVLKSDAFFFLNHC